MPLERQAQRLLRQGLIEEALAVAEEAASCAPGGEFTQARFGFLCPPLADRQSVLLHLLVAFVSSPLGENDVAPRFVCCCAPVSDGGAP